MICSLLRYLAARAIHSMVGDLPTEEEIEALIAEYGPNPTVTNLTDKTSGSR